MIPTSRIDTLERAKATWLDRLPGQDWQQENKMDFEGIF